MGARVELGASVATFVGFNVGAGDGHFVGTDEGTFVGASVGNSEGGRVVAHSVQHSQPWAVQSTLRTSILSKRQTSLGILPNRLLFPNVSNCKSNKFARLSGTHPLKLLSFKANLTY